MRMAHALLCVLALEFVAGTSESPRNPHLAPARALLKEFKEEEALKVLVKAQRWPMNTPQDLAQTHLLMGLAWAALAREDKAIESFKLARMLEPGLVLPDEQPPRVKEWWARAVADAPTTTPEPSAEPPVVVEPAPQQPQPATLIVPSRPVPVTRWLGGAGVGVGLALIVAAITQGVSASAHFSSSQRLVGLGESQAEYAAALAASQRANWLYVLGGVALVAGGLTFGMSF
jgi:hypothetical protein